MKQRSEAEAIAECYRLVAEAEKNMSPYQYALFVQRLARRFRSRALARSRRELAGGCVLLTARNSPPNAQVIALRETGTLRLS